MLKVISAREVCRVLLVASNFFTTKFLSFFNNTKKKCLVRKNPINVSPVLLWFAVPLVMKKKAQYYVVDERILLFHFT